MEERVLKRVTKIYVYEWKRWRWRRRRGGKKTKWRRRREEEEEGGGGRSKLRIIPGFKVW